MRPHLEILEMRILPSSSHESSRASEVSAQVAEFVKQYTIPGAGSQRDRNDTAKYAIIKIFTLRIIPSPTMAVAKLHNAQYPKPPLTRTPPIPPPPGKMKKEDQSFDEAPLDPQENDTDPDGMGNSILDDVFAELGDSGLL